MNKLKNTVADLNKKGFGTYIVKESQLFTDSNTTVIIDDKPDYFLFF